MLRRWNIWSKKRNHYRSQAKKLIWFDAEYLRSLSRKDRWVDFPWDNVLMWVILRTGVESPRRARCWKHIRSLQDSVCKRKCVVWMKGVFAAVGITHRRPRGPIIDPRAYFHHFSPRHQRRVAQELYWPVRLWDFRDEVNYVHPLYENDPFP